MPGSHSPPARVHRGVQVVAAAPCFPLLATPGRAGLVALVLLFLIAGCATPPSGPPAAPEPAVVECAPCVEAKAEVQRLRRELAARDIEVRDLRALQREQARALEDTAKQATRARARLRARATQADAASAIAEVEVALAGAGADADRSLVALARQLLDAATAAYGRGDWGAAVESGERAVPILAIAREAGVRQGAPRRRGGITAFEESVPLQVRVDSHLRQQPGNRGEIVGHLVAGTRVLGLGHWRGWMRVLSEDGRTGWVYRPLLAPR